MYISMHRALAASKKKKKKKCAQNFTSVKLRANN